MLRGQGIELHPAQGRILFALWQHGPMSIQELSRRTSLGKSTLTSMLDRLESAGHLRRAADPADRRKIILHLTAQNHRLHRRYEQVSAEMTGLFYQGIPAAHVDQFELMLEKILANLERFDAGKS